MDPQNKTKKRNRAPRFKKRKPLTTCKFCLGNDQTHQEKNEKGSPNFFKNVNGEVESTVACTCNEYVRCHDRTCLFYTRPTYHDRTYDKKVASGELVIDGESETPTSSG